MWGPPSTDRWPAHLNRLTACLYLLVASPLCGFIIFKNLSVLCRWILLNPCFLSSKKEESSTVGTVGLFTKYSQTENERPISPKVTKITTVTPLRRGNSDILMKWKIVGEDKIGSFNDDWRLGTLIHIHSFR